MCTAAAVIGVLALLFYCVWLAAGKERRSSGSEKAKAVHFPTDDVSVDLRKESEDLLRELNETLSGYKEAS